MGVPCENPDNTIEQRAVTFDLLTSFFAEMYLIKPLSWTRLRDHATQDRFVYRHRWSVGDMVIWDNTGTMHKAEAYPADSGRMMHRTKLQGEEPFA